jgi:hypothetical protein
LGVVLKKGKKKNGGGGERGVAGCGFLFLFSSLDGWMDGGL